MSSNTQSTWFAGMSKKSALLVALCVSLCVFTLAWLVSSIEYGNKKRDVLAGHQESMQSWVNGTVGAVEVWTDSLKAQIKRVSGSDMYRLFASELAQSDERTSALINESDSGVNLPDSESYLAEEVPLIRNHLLEFMNYSGMMDTRIVTPQGGTLLSALARPTPMSQEQKNAINQAILQNKLIFAPVRGTASTLVMDIIDPLDAVMSTDGQDKPVAAVLVSTPVTGQVAQFLARDMRQNTLLPHILQQVGSRWEEVRVQSPVPVPLDASMTQSLNFGEDGSLPFALRPGLNGQESVYSLGMRVPGTDWWVVLETPEHIVQSDLASMGKMVYGIGALISIGIVLGLALLWWVMVGHQQRVIAERFQHLYALIERQKRLLDSVNVSLDVGLFMSDINGNIQLGNRAFAEIARTDEDSLEGNTLSTLFDGRAAGQILDHIREIADTDNNVTFEMALPQQDGEHLYRMTLFPFEDTSDHGAKGAVAIMQDITEFRRNSEKRRLQQIHTLDAFVKAVEGVDPYLAGHSHQMAVLGELIAKRMGLNEADLNTINMAANLSQVGKLFVPRDLLGKSGKLTEEEQQEMARVPEHAYRVLKDIDFELPVPDAIYEMYERMDGTGYPQHLKGDQINLHARVLAVVNAFTAMVRPRAYRARIPVEDAITNLRDHKEIYDPQIVDILAEVLNTPAGAQALRQSSAE